MDIGSLLFGLALLLVSAFLIAQPLLERPAAPGSLTSTLEALQAEREAILAALRDLDFDYSTGKITTEDHRTQRAALVQRGAEVLRALDIQSPTDLVDADIERAIAARREGAKD
ncbi:MAG: hypothetical protein ACT4QE_00530 [Anaerolineales bacterium]